MTINRREFGRRSLAALGSLCLPACLSGRLLAKEIASGKNVFYVNGNAPDGGDGLSWGSAFNSFGQVPTTEIGETHCVMVNCDF